MTHHHGGICQLSSPLLDEKSYLKGSAGLLSHHRVSDKRGLESENHHYK
jgi:hypothetical protein